MILLAGTPALGGGRGRRGEEEEEEEMLGDCVRAP